MQHVKELVHVVDSRRLHEHAVIPAHSHGDQLGAEPSAVRLRIAAAGDHLQLALLPL